MNSVNVENYRIYSFTLFVGCIFSLWPTRRVSSGSMFLYCSYWSKLLLFYFQKIVAYNSLEFYVVLLLILGNIELNTSGFIERSYFESLKTQPNITAPQPFCCSHIHVTFMLNFLPISPLLCPEPLDIHFSCYHRSGVNIQHTESIWRGSTSRN
jgi:hypothetical protein